VSDERDYTARVSNALLNLTEMGDTKALEELLLEMLRRMRELERSARSA